ncbi:MAG: DedA family protein [Candidatus Saccharimonadales bacterium]
MHVMEFLQSLSPDLIYAFVFGVVMIESFGVPLPGEITLMSAAFLAAHNPHINPVVVASVAIVGASIGDSVGYWFGYHYGRRLLRVLQTKLPHEFSDDNIALSEAIFHRHGMWAVFFGRFVALLRIFAGPLAGILKMHYPKFLVANVTGAVLWAGTVTAGVYFAGLAAEPYLRRFSWIAFFAIGLVTTLGWLFFRPAMRRILLRLAGK